MPIAALLPLILQGIQAAISAAPSVIAIVQSAKDFISSLFGAGLITKAQQDALHQAIDAHAALVAQGIIPDWWKVEADPVTVKFVAPAIKS